MHSVRLEPTKLVLIGSRTTYQATGSYQSVGENGTNELWFIIPSSLATK